MQMTAFIRNHFSAVIHTKLEGILALSLNHL